MARKRKHIKPQPGYLAMPHGPNPWHFRDGRIEGNGFSGQIKHAWAPSPPMAMPARGFIHG